MSGKDKIVVLLINSKGIDVNSKDECGYTALDRGLFKIKFINL